MTEQNEGVSFIDSDTPYLDIRPRKYDVTISLYGVPGRLFGTLRQVIMNLVPANIDVSVTSEEVGTDYASSLEHYDENTLVKACEVLDNIGSISWTGEEIVRMLQNKGILFRERS